MSGFLNFFFFFFLKKILIFFSSPRSIYKVHDEAKDKEFELELSWVCEESGFKHQLVPKAIFDESVQAAKVSASSFLEIMEDLINPPCFFLHRLPLSQMKWRIENPMLFLSSWKTKT